MNVSYEFKWNQKTKRGLERIPDTILYKIAHITLAFSVPMIPKDSKTMSRETVANGVRGSNGDFYLRSSPGYASYVWKMNDSTTHWTTPGTHSQWFARALKRNSAVIIDNAIKQSWKDEM